MGFKRDKKTYEQVYFYPPLMTLRPAAADLAALNRLRPAAGRDTSVYVHIPFCTGHCTYCHYVTYAGQHQRQLDAYLDILASEAGLLKERGWFDGRTADIVHVGGGTPTYLDTAQIRRVTQIIRDTIQLSRKAEVTWETSPETVVGSGAPKLSVLLDNGVNRLSIGIESFDDRLLKVCGRRYRVDTALHAYDEARRRGFRNVNIDMIYGLASQSLDDWMRSLHVVATLRPDCVTTYHLRMKPGTPMASWHLETFPGEDACRDMQIATVQRLTAAGYTQVLGNQFVQHADKVYRYEVHKWQDTRDIIGLGVSAYSYIDGWAYCNWRAMEDYTRALGEARLPIQLERRLSREQRAARMVVLGLRVVPNGVDKKLFEAIFGMPLDATWSSTIRELERLGLIENRTDRLLLTAIGTLFADEVCIQFYADDDVAQLRAAGASKYGLYLDCPVHLSTAGGRKPINDNTVGEREGALRSGPEG